MFNMKIIIISLLTLFVFSPDKVCGDIVEDLIPQIIMAESSGNPNAYNKEGSYGLMGISLICLSEFNAHHQGGNWLYNIGDLYNPKINVKVGSFYIQWIIWKLPDEYKDSKTHIISAYNNGIGWLKKNKWQPPKSSKNKIYNQVYQEYWRDK